MEKRFNQSEVTFIMNMKKVKYSNCAIARSTGVTEGAIRYRIKREASGLPDKRKLRGYELDKYHDIIGRWIEDYEDETKRPTFIILYEELRTEHGYEGSYDMLRYYIHKCFPSFYKKKLRIRIETPPGHLLQVDWKEDLKVQFLEAGNWVTINAMVFALCYSRKTVVIFSQHKDLDAFIFCHQHAFHKLGGLPLLIRMDCLKSAITRWRSKEAILNERYKNYITRLGIDAFPSRPGTPTDKGKVEKRIRDIFSRLDFRHKVYKSMKELQDSCDEKILELEKVWRCGATGHSVEKSFAYEQKRLKPLPESFPLIPLKEERCRVRDDGTIRFCNNYYQVPGKYRGCDMLCINTGSEIIFYRDGEEIERFSFLPQSKGMVMLSEKVLNDENLEISDRVRFWALEVAQRQVDIYHEILQGGAR